MNSAVADRPLRVGMISLGCAKNLVDAEIMLGSLLQDGMQIVNDAAGADVVIINTCSFIDTAQEESVDAILQSAALREARHRGQGLVVSGCLPQRFREELPKLLPEVDAFMGIDQVAQVGEIVRGAFERRALRLGNSASQNRPVGGKRIAAKVAAGEEERIDSMAGNGHGAGGLQASTPAEPFIAIHDRPTYIPDFATPRFRLTPSHFAYLKIAEGCNHPCSFCTIPRMRGSHRSRRQEDIVTEARRLIAEGVRELNLISQDSTYYGMDLRSGQSRNIASPEKFGAAARSLPAQASNLCTLLTELNALPGDFWIRLLYTHPAHWTDELIQTMARCPKVARYVDMPLQHIHPNMLERMRRETSREYIEELIQRLRAGIPGIALRTTFIVGFPGETDGAFEALLQFIEESRFERLGVFTYSREEGTRAGRMESQIPDKLKRQRRDLAMAAQRKVAEKIAASMVGRTIKALVEKEATAAELKQASISSWEHGLIRGRNSGSDRLRGRYLVARSEADAPDIDGRVYVRGRLRPGEFAEVKIAGHTTYDLIGEPV